MKNYNSKGSFESKEIKLPSPKKEGKISLETLLDNRKSIRTYVPGALTLQQVSQTLWASSGKNRWAKLTVPSAGACYPLAIYIVAGQIEGVQKGLYRYNCEGHSLRCINTEDIRSPLCRACLNQAWIKNAAAILIICADYQMTTSHYGARGRRYVDIEIGHAGQNVYLEATALGLGTVAIGAFADEEVKEILRIPETPLYLMPLGRLK
ncbi:MAG: SagB/ThcOx family dehydrogenase [Candidatus Omnitrophota bacterium]|nr:MAG: SagB/ThcOx family dehydrogenase [Candidatus Omnitrophota bacterium]